MSYCFGCFNRLAKLCVKAWSDLSHRGILQSMEDLQSYETNTDFVETASRVSKFGGCLISLFFTLMATMTGPKLQQAVLGQAVNSLRLIRDR